MSLKVLDQKNITVEQQIKSDSVTLLMGALSNLDYLMFRYNQSYFKKQFRFDVKKWVNEVEDYFGNSLQNTFDMIAEKFPVCADLLDVSFIRNTYFILNKTMMPIKDINLVFNSLSNDSKTTKSIKDKLVKKFESDPNNKYEILIVEQNKAMYINLLFVKYFLDNCKDNVIYNEPKFKGFITKGLDIYSKRITPEDKSYYDSCCKVLGQLDLHNFMLVSEVATAYDYDMKALMGTTK